MSDKKVITSWQVVDRMAELNMDIAAATELTNFQRQVKKNGGLVTVGVGSPHFDHLINQAASGEDNYRAILLIVNSKQFDQLKSKMESEAKVVTP